MHPILNQESESTRSAAHVGIPTGNTLGGRRLGLPAAAVLPLLTGCLVGQPPGMGQSLHLTERETRAGYWLYLPQGYRASADPRRPPDPHPLVVTFHGMKPFDSASGQIREWQAEADRYGYVVCAPALSVAGLLGPPLSDPDNPSLRRDERNVLAIMDELYRTVNVDPNKVLATSWSYGGYVAHYMANRHPERFSCVAVRQSNFNENLLDPQTVRRYRDHKIGIFYTQNDFPICRRESREAARWYAKHGFDLTLAIFEKKGHERTPGVAAEFFARTIGVQPKTPPTELASMQVIDIPAPDEAVLRAGRFTGPPDERPARPENRLSATIPPAGRPRRDATSPAVVAQKTLERFPPTVSTRSAALKNQPLRAATARRLDKPAQDAVSVKVNADVGIAPMLLIYKATMPAHLRRTASILWTVDGEPVSNAVGDRKVLHDPGRHVLAVVVTRPGKPEIRASKTITVYARNKRRR